MIPCTVPRVSRTPFQGSETSNKEALTSTMIYHLYKIATCTGCIRAAWQCRRYLASSLSLSLVRCGLLIAIAPRCSVDLSSCQRSNIARQDCGEHALPSRCYYAAEFHSEKALTATRLQPFDLATVSRSARSYCYKTFCPSIDMSVEKIHVLLSTIILPVPTTSPAHHSVDSKLHSHLRRLPDLLQLPIPLLCILQRLRRSQGGGATAQRAGKSWICPLTGPASASFRVHCR